MVLGDLAATWGVCEYDLFVTEDTALERLEFSAGGQRVENLAVFSDGIEPLVLDYANKSAHAPFFDRMFAPIRESTASGEDTRLSEAMSSPDFSTE